MLTDPLPDLWTGGDAPVLAAVAGWELRASPDGSFLGMDELLLRLERLPDDASTVAASVARLARGGYLEAGAITVGSPYPHWVTRLTPNGLRAVGVWPHPDAAVEGLGTALEELADRLEAHSPDRAKGLRSALPGIRSALKEVGVDLASRVLARAAGLG